MGMKRHSEEFIKKIFQLSRERGLSARQIAEVMSPEYRDYNGVDMTRNSVISILNRYSRMFTHIGKKKPERINFSSVVEQLEEARQSMKNKDEYRVKKVFVLWKRKTVAQSYVYMRYV